MIERFLNGDATEEEKGLVAGFFRNHPDKLAQYLTEKSWGDFNPDAADTGQTTPAQKMLAAIEDRIGKISGVGQGEEIGGMQADTSQQTEKGSRVIDLGKWRLARIASAAAVLVAAGVAIFYWMETGRPKRPLPGIEYTQATAAGEPPHSTRRTISNTSSRARIYSLPDGSTVKLAAHSEVSCYQPFGNHRRDFLLQGEGLFTVKKDPTRPFTVHSNGIATTALGTVFSVDDKGRRFAIVHLFSGRVVVKKEQEKDPNALNGATTAAFRDVYLLPGQELVLNKENFSAQVRAAEPASRMTDTAATHSKLLEFTRQPLPDVLSLLGKEYKVTISYDTAGMKNMDFTGVFNHDKETLESFLGTLCDLNGLTLIKQKANHFSIREK